MPSSEFICIPCNRTFGSADALFQHRRDAPNHHFCKHCDRYFETADALKNHMMDSHYFCTPCEQGFWTKDALMAHYRDSKKHHYCVPCGVDFKYASMLRKHQKSYFRHMFCNFCSKGFKDASFLEVHHREEHFVCGIDVCKRVLRTFEDGVKHTVETHPYCNECEELRVFRTEQDLAQHLLSVHNKNTITCQGTGCGKEFKLWGALTQHYNSGGCPSGLNGPEFTKLVIHLFKTNAIPDLGKVLLRTIGAGGTTTSAPLESCWNGHAYECPCGREFKSLQKMNRHARTPGHKARAFRCPKCANEFAIASDVVQHLESRKCGENTFEKVKKAFQMLNGCIETGSMF